MSAKSARVRFRPLPSRKVITGTGSGLGNGVKFAIVPTARRDKLPAWPIWTIASSKKMLMVAINKVTNGTLGMKRNWAMASSKGGSF